MSLETDDSFDRKISFPRTDKILSQSSNFETYKSSLSKYIRDNSTALKQIDDNENQTVPVKDYLHLMKKYKYHEILSWYR